MALSAPEDLAPGARVATLGGVDPDGDALRIGRALDFETEPALNFRVRATDPGGLSFETDLSLAVRDVDEAPVLSAQGALVSAPASLDLSSRRLAAELTVADDALGSAEISLSGPDAELFEIWRGDLYLIEGADIGPGGGTLEVTVSAVDPALGPSEQGVARVVVAVEPAPPTPIRGENEADRIAGSDGADRIEGLAGDDAIRGQAGDDVVLGGAGADRLRGQAGDDVLKGEKATTGCWAATARTACSAAGGTTC
ncbi:MAG: hypothetical protein VYD87_19735 [Pseudomonadota bacterium]|nr:hypothetical protein [Pseudomonadota bacterium]MEE3101611.1 hypothetical protein [Pseudomonadota bacterium]